MNTTPPVLTCLLCGTGLWAAHLNGSCACGTVRLRGARFYLVLAPSRRR